ncbi:MAG: hypothetical protein H6736_18575 [Alphaproteobacteria bacterium]|nr:hypothetical protein [Alphaproteobacteria bacterium]MCB9693822.1 hypothetical protein [Alphaproteobacteria bacterium]
MPYTIEEFVAAWQTHYGVLVEQSQELEDTYEDSREAADDMIQKVKEIWKANRIASWPDQTRLTLEKLRDDGIEHARAKRYKKAQAILETLRKEVLDIHTARHHSKKLMESTDPSKKSITKHFPKKEECDERQLELVKELRGKMKKAQDIWDQGKSLHEVDAFFQAAKNFESAKVISSEAVSRARSEPFRESATIEINQDVFSTSEDGTPLLDLLQSQGVCHALVLDFLGSGESGGEPGSPVKGKITSKHVKAQAQYELAHKMTGEKTEKILEQAKKLTLEEITSYEQQIEVCEHNLEYARERLQEARDLQSRVGPDLAEATRLLQLKQGEYSQVEGYPDFDGKAETLVIVQRRVDALQQRVDELTRVKNGADEDVRRFGELGTQCEGLIQTLTREKTSRESEVDGLREQLKHLTKQARKLVELYEKSSNPGFTPSVLLEQFGVQYKEDGTLTHKPETGDFLTGEEVAKALVDSLAKVAKGAEGSFQISVTLAEGGHAIGMRGKHAEDDSWVIDWFDPNANGYQFDTVDKFLTFLGKYYKTVYSSKWKKVKTSEVSITPPTDTVNTLLGPSAREAFEQDYEDFDDLCKKMIGDPVFPRKLGEELAGEALTAYNRLPDVDTATEIDLLIARNRLEDIRARLREAISLSERYGDLLEQMRPELQTASQRVKDAFAKAVAAHHDGDLAKALKLMEQVANGRDQDTIRGVVDTMDTTRGEDTVVEETAECLDELMGNLRKTGKMVIVKNLDELAAAFAADKSMPVDTAKQRILENKGRGFTGTDGTVYVLAGADSAHDCVHETVHIMSAPGGATKILAEWGEQLNEGFTEFFTKQMCAKLGVTDAASYVDHVAFMNKLAPVVGHATLYKAYMQNQGMDGVLDVLVKKWVEQGDTITKSVYRPPKTSGDIDPVKCRDQLTTKLKSSFPPTGPMLNFWSAVYGF